MPRLKRLTLSMTLAAVASLALLGCTNSATDSAVEPTGAGETSSSAGAGTAAAVSTTATNDGLTSVVDSSMAALDTLPDVVDRVIGSVVLIESINGIGSGSGIVLDTEGHILTNYHVVESMDRIKVTLYEGAASEATVTGTDPSNDLAVVRATGFTPDQLQPATLGDSSAVRVGQRVFAIGNPFSERFTVTQGIISALNRSSTSLGGRSIQGVLQTDAALNPGNSGGPLFNLAGEVVGINTSIRNPQGQSFAGLGFAVPSNTAQRYLSQLVSGETIEHPQLGVGGPLRLDQVVAAEIGVAETRGLYITSVLPGGAAERAGMLSGDIVLEVNGQPTYSFEDLARAIDSASVGDTVDVVIVRDGERMTLTAELRPWGSS